jgi:caffeoyl-CoA O-methyltransferase
VNGVFGSILAVADVNSARAADGEKTRAAFTEIAAAARRGGTLVESLMRAASAADSGTDSAVERDLTYLEGIHVALDPVAAELEKSGRGESIPIVDREVGRVLSILVTALRPKNILEIGTAFGYSALWMARAQDPGGRILTIDPDRSRTDIAAGFFRRAGVSDRIEIVNRPALEVLPGLARDSFDFVFIDALKEEYSDYLRLSVPLLKRRGMIAADNLLWGHAASLPPSSSDAESTRGVRRFNEGLLRHPELEATIVPIGDGLGLAVKR